MHLGRTIATEGFLDDLTHIMHKTASKEIRLGTLPGAALTTKGSPPRLRTPSRPDAEEGPPESDPDGFVARQEWDIAPKTPPLPFARIAKQSPHGSEPSPRCQRPRTCRQVQGKR